MATIAWIKTRIKERPGMKVGHTPGVDQSEPISPPSVCHSCQPGGLPAKSRHGTSPARRGTMIHVHMPAGYKLFSHD